MEKLPQNESSKKIEGRVWYVESPEDETVLVGMDLEVDPNTKNVAWIDTVKERRMQYDNILSHNPGDFSFHRLETDGTSGTYSFSPMTLETYNSKVKDKLLSGNDFTDEEAMLKAFEETRRNVW